MERTAARRILWRINKTSFYMWIMIMLFNISISTLISWLSGQDHALRRIVSSGIFTVGGAIIGTVITLAIVMIAQGLDYMINLYIDRGTIYRAIQEVLISVNACIAVVMTMAIWIYIHYGFTDINRIFLFGIKGSDLNAISYILFFYYVFVMGFVTIMYCMFITLLAKRYSWHYLVGTIFLTLALGIYRINEIRLFFMTGEKVYLVFTVAAIIGLIIAYINNYLVRRVEVKG